MNKETLILQIPTESRARTTNLTTFPDGQTLKKPNMAMPISANFVSLQKFRLGGRDPPTQVFSEKSVVRR